jgi:hypothetical protein
MLIQGRFIGFTSVLIGCLLSSNSLAQMINVQTPFTTLNDSFFERNGINFGFQFAGGNPAGNGSRIVGLLPDGSINPTGNLVFSQNSAGSAIPQFGGFDPNTAATFGYINQGDNFGYSLGFSLSSGSTRTLSSQAPNVTVMNGQTGTINSNQFRPFVTGIIPVVGSGTPIGYAPGYNWRVTPVYEQRNRFADMLAAGGGWNGGQNSQNAAQQNMQQPDDTSQSSDPVTYSSTNSTANHGDLSVAEIKRQRQLQLAAEQKELQDTIRRAEAFEAAGDFSSARLEYNRAIRKSTGEQRQKLKQHYEQLKKKR